MPHIQIRSMISTTARKYYKILPLSEVAITVRGYSKGDTVGGFDAGGAGERREIEEIPLCRIEGGSAEKCSYFVETRFVVIVTYQIWLWICYFPIILQTKIVYEVQISLQFSRTSRLCL